MDKFYALRDQVRKWYDEKPNDYSKFIQFLVKFFFKIRTVRQEHPGTIKTATEKAVNEINQGGSYDDVIAKLKEYDKHDDFVYNFENTFVVKPKKDAAKYVLKEITQRLNKKHEVVNCESESEYDDMKPIDELTLEHILPKKHDKWDHENFFKGYDDDRKKFDDFVIRLGNMTLLKQSVNTKLQNESFENKKDYLDKDGKQAGYLSSQLKINKLTVCNYKEWTANIIMEREKIFKKCAKEIWKLD